LSVGIDRFDVHPGSATAIPVWAIRKGYTGLIRVRVIGHSGISGQVTIPPGRPAAPNQPAATLFLTASPETPPGPYELALEGSASINGRTVIQLANLRSVVSQELGGLPFPPRNLLTRIGVAVTERSPFTLAARADQPVTARGTPISLIVRATRAPGFVEEIALSAVALPPTVALAMQNIPKGQDEVHVQLTPAANAALGAFSIGITGKAKFQNKEFSVTSQPIDLELALPFELAVEPGHLKVIQGGKAKVKVTAVRKAYQGPIAVELRNLPPNVTAPKATLAVGQTTAEIDVTVATNAPVGDKADLHVLGATSGASVQQQPSPNFKISIMKKS
jgi:hypothetical protein